MSIFKLTCVNSFVGISRTSIIPIQDEDNAASMIDCSKYKMSVVRVSLSYEDDQKPLVLLNLKGIRVDLLLNQPLFVFSFSQRKKILLNNRLDFYNERDKLREKSECSVENLKK